MKTTTEHVRACITRTKEHDPEYFKKCLEQRLLSGKGSCYSYTDIKDLEWALMHAMWEPYYHENIAAGCHAFITHDQHLNGWIGVVPLKDLPDDMECYFIDPKGTGKLSLSVKPFDGDMVKCAYTVLITGADGYGECMFTFHPGEPLKPSTLSADGRNEYGVKLGDHFSVKLARDIGFKHAKIDREAGK